MGTSADAVMTDKLGRRSGPRRRYTMAEKRSMVEETQLHGASVPEVAQRHGINPNLLSIWRRLHRQGLPDEKGAAQGALLPVRVSTPTVLPSERAAAPKAAEKSSGVQIEVEFSGGQRLRIRGAVDRALLRDLVSALSSR
jgi:transposase-like protein